MNELYPSITGIEIIPIEPRAIDLTYLENISRAEGVQLPRVAYIVKIFLDQLPAPTGAGMQVLLGEEPIRRYGQFSRGIFLLVHNPRFLSEHAGAPIRFRWDGTEPSDTGWQFPSSSVAAEGAIAAAETAPRSSFEDALERSVRG